MLWAFRVSFLETWTWNPELACNSPPQGPWGGQALLVARVAEEGLQRAGWGRWAAAWTKRTPASENSAVLLWAGILSTSVPCGSCRIRWASVSCNLGVPTAPVTRLFVPHPPAWCLVPTWPCLLWALGRTPSLPSSVSSLNVNLDESKPPSECPPLYN